eukprot:4127681-Amphidinium_carterae.1
MGSEPEPEAVLSPASPSEPLLPLHHSAAAGTTSGVASGWTPSSTSSCTIATQTLPVSDSVAASLLSGLQAGPVYIVWSIGETSTLPPGIHIGPDAWSCITRHIPGCVYRSGIDRLRRLSVVVEESEAERLQRALALFLSEAHKHRVPTRCFVHFWK